MAKRALIVESEYQALSGFHNNAACIEQVLRSRGFETELCRGRDATRAGILAAYGRLIDDTRADDAAVVYYTGHGGIAVNSAYAPDGELPRYVQHICPSDFWQTTDDDFRGITALELSLQLAALTRRTHNATVILECCYAAQMSRGPAPAPDRQPTPVLTRVGLTRHLRALRERERDFEALELTGNRNAVRVAAAGQRGSAFQLPVPPTGSLRAMGIDLPEAAWLGGLTLVLAQLLAEIGDARVTWRSLGVALRARLPEQRPEVEGPVTRVPFSLATVDSDAVAVRSDRGVAIVDAGRLLGVSVGDVFDVLPDGAAGPPIETLTIDEVAATQSRAQRRRPHERELPPGAVAVAVSKVLARAPVRVVADERARAEIEAAIEAARSIRPAGPADREPLAELRVHDDTLELHDAGGRLFAPARYPDHLADAVHDLENLAAERRLRALSHGAPLAPSEITVELLVSQDGAFRRLAAHGEVLGLRDRIAVRLENHTEARTFAHVFNVGLRRRITRLSAHAALGIELRKDEPQYVGTSAAGPLEGFGLRWPDGLPRDQARLDTVLVVVTPEPADLGVLERGEHLTISRGKPPALEDVLGPLAGVRTRGAGLAPGSFALCWREFPLVPVDATLCFGVPQVDASPTAVARSSEAAALRIRLARLAVAPDTRLDVLVCARSMALPYRATTLAGAAPSELVVWAGELRGAADIYVWTSPGGRDQPTLAELLAQRPLGEPLAILRAAHDDPRAALAVGASLQLAATARAALRAIGDPATAFRGSFGPGDGTAPPFGSAASRVPAPADEHRQRFEAAAVAFDVAIDLDVSPSLTATAPDAEGAVASY